MYIYIYIHEQDVRTLLLDNTEQPSISFLQVINSYSPDNSDNPDNPGESSCIEVSMSRMYCC